MAGKQTRSDTQSNAGIGVARGVLLALSLAACAQGTAPDVVIGPAGAAGIGAATPMDLDAIADAAPGYVVEEGETVSGERRFARFTLSLGGEAVFTVYPAPDRSRPVGIGTRSARARGARGEAIGITTFAQSAGVDAGACRPAMAHERFSFSCPDPSGSFWRAYQIAEGDPGLRNGFAAIPADVRDRAVLAQMYWTPPAD
jgi:hypothetical protein